MTQLVIIGLERRGRLKAIQLGSREQALIIQEINAAGQAIPLFIIFTSQYHLSAQYEEDILRDQAITVSDNGQITNEIGAKQLKHFIKHIDSKVVEAHQLLIFNGYISHHSLKFQELYKENNIYTLYMPPYSSHLL